MSLEIILLPDDVMVKVMQYLDVEDVLACRLVSWRFSDLALHRDVWRDRAMDACAPYAGAVLRLAPCLDTLSITDSTSTTTMIATTTCAVANLVLQQEKKKRYVEYNDLNAAVAAVYDQALRNQESLGRLRRLELNCPHMPTADGLARTVASLALCSNLEALVIHGLSAVFQTVPQVATKSSLTHFRFPPVKDNSAPFVHATLARHAATLEAVELSGFYYSSKDTRTSCLLATMPKLRRLVCSNTLQGLEAVAACTTLREVAILMAVSSSRGHFQRTLEFLGRARQLRTVHLHWVHYRPEITEADAQAQVAKALNSSGPSRIQRLIVEACRDVRRLLHRLPSLNALCFLDEPLLDGHELLLSSINPSSAPALRRLDLRLDYMDGTGGLKCPHAWLHRHMDLIKETLTVNPSLHIQVWIDTCRRLPNCEVCAQGCHQEVQWSCDNAKLGLFSHALDKCPSPEDHTVYTNWHIYRRSSKVMCRWIRI